MEGHARLFQHEAAEHAAASQQIAGHRKPRAQQPGKQCLPHGTGQDTEMWTGQVLVGGLVLEATE